MVENKKQLLIRKI